MATRRIALLTGYSKQPKSACLCGCGQIPKDGKIVLAHQLDYVRQHYFDFNVPRRLPVEPESTPAKTLLTTVFADAFFHKHGCRRRSCRVCQENREWAQATADWGITSFIALCDYLNVPWERARARFLATAY